MKEILLGAVSGIIVALLVQRHKIKSWRARISIAVIAAVVVGIIWYFSLSIT